jgi:predicted nuclease of predicted toxin-antitoxin system
MKIRFQADADVNQIILLATVRREPAIDFQTALAAGLAHLSDREVLATAARVGRLLVTHDQRTMPRHFAEFITTQTSPGLLIIPQHLSVSLVVEDLVLIWSTTEAEEWINRICFLPL